MSPFTSPCPTYVVVQELAANAPTLFNSHVPEFLRKMWGALRDPKLPIREAAVEAFDPSHAVASSSTICHGAIMIGAQVKGCRMNTESQCEHESVSAQALSACLQLISRRDDSPQRQKWYDAIFKEVRSCTQNEGLFQSLLPHLSQQAQFLLGDNQ